MKQVNVNPPQLITPESELRNHITQLLHPIKQLAPHCMLTLVMRSPGAEGGIADGVLLLSEETDTDILCNAINRAAQVQIDKKAKQG